MNMTKHRRFGRKMWLKIPLFIAVMVFAKSAVVMWLWNALIPELFHGPLVSYWQALGLLVLAKLLVGFGFRGGGFGGGFGRGRGGPFGRWENMSPEEREKLREKLERKFGRFERGEK